MAAGAQHLMLLCEGDGCRPNEGSGQQSVDVSAQGAYPAVPHDPWSIYGGRALPPHAVFFSLSIAFALQIL